MELEEMVRDATRECDAPWEQVLGLYGRVQQRLALPLAEGFIPAQPGVRGGCSGTPGMARDEGERVARRQGGGGRAARHDVSAAVSAPDEDTVGLCAVTEQVGGRADADQTALYADLRAIRCVQPEPA